ncbi:MAG: hypothetical protein V4858_04415 [Pseudomonadota bacterium]
MSITYDSSVYVVKTDSLPNAFTSADQLDAFIKDKDSRLWGATRSGWMHWVLRDVSIGYGIKNLAFMGINCGDTKLERIDLDYYPDGAYAHYYASVISGNRLSEVVGDIERLIDLSIKNTSIVAKLMEHHTDSEEVLSAAKDSSISRGPRIEVGDEGEGPWYFFTYLRTFKGICEAAKLEGSSVFYVQDTPA